MTNDEIYEFAANAVKRKKFSQAIDYFLKILKDDPEYIEARRGLRIVEVNQFNGKKVPALLSGLHLLAKIVFFKLKKDYDNAILACEDFLKLDPTHLWTLKQMATFAIEKEYSKTARFTYESLAELAPMDAGIVIEAADYLSDLGEPDAYEKANTMMSALSSADPTNTDLSQEQSRIAAKKSVNKFETAKTTTDVLKNKDQAKELEEESQEIRTEDDLDKAIERALERTKEDPKNARHQETMADLLFRKGKLMDSLKYYENAVKYDPNNQSVLARLGDTKIKILSHQILKMEKRLTTLKGNEEQELKQRIKANKKKLVDQKLAEYSRRLKVNPNDMPTRFELGCLYFNSKAIDKAIQQFQKSVVDAKLSFKSSQYLGHCFKAKKLYDIAIKEFYAAAKKPGANTKDRLNVQYEVGNCYLEINKVQEALDVFKKILEKDFGFKDVADQVESLQNKLKDHGE